MTVDRGRITEVAELNTQLSSVEKVIREITSIERFRSYPAKPIRARFSNTGKDGFDADDVGDFTIDTAVLKPLLDQYADYLRKKLEALGVKL